MKTIYETMGVKESNVSKLKRSTAFVRLQDLMGKVRSGTATKAEREEYESRTKRARELDPNVLVD